MQAGAGAMFCVCDAFIYQATKAAEDGRRQLRVARAAMYLIVWRVTDRQLLCVQVVLLTKATAQ